MLIFFDKNLGNLELVFDFIYNKVKVGVIMNKNTETKEIQSIKKGIASHFPLLEPFMSRVPFQKTNDVKTAATNGHQVFYADSYTSKLTFEEKIFLFAHEIMHIAFDHVMRSGTKDPKVWNYATDAVINQRLKASGLPMPAGGIDIPEAANKSAEEMYDKLMEKEKPITAVDAQSEHKLWADAVQEAITKYAQKQISPELSSQREKHFTQANEALKKEIEAKIKDYLHFSGKNKKLTTFTLQLNRDHLKKPNRIFIQIQTTTRTIAK